MLPAVHSVRVLVACEYSGRVRDAFAAKGFDAWSCDLLESETPGNHYTGSATSTPVFTTAITPAGKFKYVRLGFDDSICIERLAACVDVHALPRRARRDAHVVEPDNHVVDSP